MLMPIVSMNKMAMNESVAATCCYHETASPTNVYWEILHGGWIGAGYVNELVLLDPAYKSWTALGYDVNVPKGVSLDYLVKTVVPAPTADDATATKTVYLVGANQIDLYDYLGSGLGITLGDCCDHNTVDCKYYTEIVSHKTNMHFQATSAHGKYDTTKKWSNPHDPVKFNS